MKRRTEQHPKFYELQAALGCSKPVAVGLLELLWHTTSDYCPAGDVGRFSDTQIARAVGYEGDASELIAALVSSGWLDVSDQHRLLVHDWPEHADDYVHLRLARARLRFADGTEPSLKRMSKAERDRLEATAPVQRTASARQAHAVATAPPAALAVSLPSPAVPKETKGHAEVTWRIERCWQRFLAARRAFYQRSRGTNGTPEPRMSPQYREHIRNAIVEFDKDLLKEDEREQWELESWAAASGEGLFLDPWMTGNNPDRKLYTAPDTPWRPLRGKPHPVPRFAQLAFDARARVEPEASAIPIATPLADAPKWRAIRERLESSISPDELRTWIDPLVPVGETDRSVTLAAPSGRMAYAAEENYGEAMTRAALAAFGAPFDVKVTTADVRRTA